MMTHVHIEDADRRLTFYLAMEEYLARHLADIVPPGAGGRREAFFLWQVAPTVIYGRNQVPEAEVNMEWCKAHGVDLVRRKSGGGCVWSDWGNIMFSYVSDGVDVGWTFDSCLQRIVLALRKLGVNAERSGRNDIMVEGKKVSGNAFFLLPKSSIVHGTLLFSSDFEAMSNALTPPQCKIRSKGVSSVRQRVANLKDHVPWGMEEFKRRLVAELKGTDGTELALNEKDMDGIREVEESYLDPVFKEGRRHGYTVSRSGRMEGVGDVCVEFDMDGKGIRACRMSGDFFPLRQGLDEALTDAFAGKDELAASKADLPFGDYVMGLTAGLFRSVAFPGVQEDEETTNNKDNNMEENLKKTCLYDSHVSLGAQMSPFGGFIMPIQYKGIKDEHIAVRTDVGMFDVSHMGEVFVSGPESKKFINHIFTNDISALEPGKIVYGMMLYPDGGTVDDLLVYKMAAEDEYLLVINAANDEKDTKWIMDNVSGYDATVRHASERWGQIALQGPKAEDMLVRVMGIEDARALSFYTFLETTWHGRPAIVSRTGYTGEDGFEIYTSPEGTLEAWNLFLEAGVQPCGLGCRDTLRFEAGLPLYGDELSAEITPVMAGLGMFCKLDKEGGFIGRDVLADQKANGCARKLVGIEVHDKAIPRAGYPVELEDGTQVGVVTTGYHSISLDKSLCFALVGAEHSKLGTPLWVHIRKKVFPGEVVKKRFYQTNYKHNQ